MSIDVDWEWSGAYLYGISITRRTLQEEAKYKAYAMMIPICKEILKRILLISKLPEKNDLKDNDAIRDYKEKIQVLLLSIGRRDLFTVIENLFEEYYRQKVATDIGNEAKIKEITDKVFYEVDIEFLNLMDQLEQHETVLLLSQPSKRVRESLSTFRSRVEEGRTSHKLRRNIQDTRLGTPILSLAIMYYGVSIISLLLSDSKGLEKSLRNLIQAMQDDLEDTLSSWPWWTGVKRRWRNRN